MDIFNIVQKSQQDKKIVGKLVYGKIIDQTSDDVSETQDEYQLIQG